MALNPAIKAANGQSAPLQQAQLLSGSVMSTVAVGLAPHQYGRATGEDNFCCNVLCTHMLRRALNVPRAGTCVCPHMQLMYVRFLIFTCRSACAVGH